MYLGAHMSVAGGLEKAIERIQQVDGTALQIFTRNQRQWQAKDITGDEAENFAVAWRAWGNYPIASHASYLINLASPKDQGWQKSQAALLAETRRCAALSIPYVVLHPGSHGGTGSEEGVARVAAALDLVLADAPSQVKILLETTAGQGSGLGAKFSELADIIKACKFAERLAVCLDTCHVFAAGYDLATAVGYALTWAEFEEYIGLDRLLFIHLNDSQKKLGSRVDRHAHIGRGEIGVAGFRRLLNDPRLKDIPMVLETPKGKDLAEDRENLALLRSLVV